MPEESSTKIESVRKTKFQMIICYSAFATMLIVVLSTLIIRKSNTILKSKIAELQSELNLQVCSNINTYMRQVELSSEYLRIMTDELNDKLMNSEISRKEKSDMLREVTSFLKNFSFIRNYSDMAIIYSDGYYAGQLDVDSYNTELLYSYFNTKIQNLSYGKIWTSGDFGDYSKFYFAKMIHENSLFLCSIKTSKFPDFVSTPKTMNMETFLVNEKNQIVYSNEPMSIGNSLPAGLLKQQYTKGKLNLYNKKYLYTMSVCDNGMKLFTTASMSEVLKERRTLITYVIILSVFTVTAILIFSIIFSLKLTIPIEQLITSLHIQATKDKLTNLLNVQSFEEKVSDKLSGNDENKVYGIFFFDVDHFSTMVNVYGHDESNKIIYDVANTIRRTFPKEAVIGRLGPDRFGICAEVSRNNLDSNSVQSFCEIQQQNLFSNFQGNIDVTMSMGIALYPDHGKSFNVLLDMAERAMNTVKKNSRNNWRIFNPATDLQSYQK